MLKCRALALLPLLSITTLPVHGQDSAKPPEQSQPQEHWRMGGERFQGVRGTITELNKDKITLKTMDGRTVTVNLSPETRFRKDGGPASLNDFKVGDMVMVGGEPAGDNTWNARFVGTRSGAGAEFREGLGKRFVVGEIKSIDGIHLSVLRPDGETQTIEVDENTSFRKQRESVTLADFKVGDHVMARGELKNGTFVASTLNLGAGNAMFLSGGTERRPPDSPDHH